MKEIDVPSIRGFQELEKFSSIRVDTNNWPEQYPYSPAVTARLGHTDERLLVRFEVVEGHVLGTCLTPNGPVWTDSCAEFFVKLPDSEFYFNFETNCIGTGLSAKRRSREDFAFLAPEVVSKVVRRSSLKAEPIDIKGRGEWSLELEIPFSILGCDSCPETLLANFYKCGEKTEPMHFLSWSPISTPDPDFHRPEFFGKLNLK